MLTWTVKRRGWTWTAPGWEIGRVRHQDWTRGVTEYHLYRAGDARIVDITNSLAAAKAAAEKLSS